MYIHIYIYIYIQATIAPEVEIRVQHVFAVENDKKKQEFLLNAHKPNGGTVEFHLWTCVSVFDHGTGHCMSCNKECRVADHQVDVFFSGPSCKDISKQNSQRKNYVQCYVDGTGTSGKTYLSGFRKPHEVVRPQLSFFENTLQVAESTHGVDGILQPAMTEVGVCLHQYIYI